MGPPQAEAQGRTGRRLEKRRFTRGGVRSYRIEHPDVLGSNFPGVCAISFQKERLALTSRKRVAPYRSTLFRDSLGTGDEKLQDCCVGSSLERKIRSVHSVVSHHRLSNLFESCRCLKEVFPHNLRRNMRHLQL